MKIRSLFALVGLAISFALPIFAQQQKSLKELIVGTWLLESVYDKTQDGEKHNPWGDGVKGQAIFTSDGHFSWQMMSANRPKADTSPREPVGQVVAEWGTYTVDDAAKTYTVHIERCTFPQWDGAEGTLNLAFPHRERSEYHYYKGYPRSEDGTLRPSYELEASADRTCYGCRDEVDEKPEMPCSSLRDDENTITRCANRIGNQLCFADLCPTKRNGRSKNNRAVKCTR